MSDVEKAAQDAVAAAQDAVAAAQQSEQFALMLAAIQAAQLTQQQTCQHPPAPVQQGGNGKWIALGVAAPFLAITLAISVVGFAISVVALTICVLVLRGLWVDMQEGRKS